MTKAAFEMMCAMGLVCWWI